MVYDCCCDCCGCVQEYDASQYEGHRLYRRNVLRTDTLATLPVRVYRNSILLVTHRPHRRHPGSGAPIGVTCSAMHPTDTAIRVVDTANPETYAVTRDRNQSTTLIGMR